MAKYQYATKDGQLKTIDAESASAAMAQVKGFADAAANTGVIAVLDNPASKVITKDGAVDVSKVPAAASDVQPFAETTTTPTTTSTPPPAFLDVSSDNPDTALTNLARSATAIQSDITDLEAKMANRANERNQGYQDAGVFDDMRQLNKLKDELRTAQDRQTEIPIESRQNLRGRQATKTEFAADTRPKLEDAALQELTASRATSRLTDTINTNIAIVDSRIQAETDADQFLYTQKQKRLADITTVYGNIMTEKQKAAAQEAQFQNDLVLENIKTTNSLRSDLIKDIAKKGIGGTQLQGIMNASVDELLQFSAQLSSSVNWANLTPEQALQTLSPEDYTKYTQYQKLKADQQAEADAGLATQQSANGVISIVDAMLNDTEGLKNSVGFGLGNVDFQLFGIGNETAKFRANAKQLVSAQTLKTLTDLKAAGGTLGAISEKELAILQNASAAFNPVLDKNGNQTGRFEMKEADFVETLKTIKLASMKTYVAATIGKSAFASANYVNADYDTIKKRYDDLVANPPKATDYYSNDFNGTQALNTATEVIKQEEGLRTEAYKDSTGKWTIGFGNTTINGRPVQPGDKLSVAQANSLLQNQIVNKYTTFADNITKPITPNQFAALTSFEYNLGSGVWNQPTGQQILALVDNGDYNTAGRLMLQYNKSYNPATGQLEVNPALVARRNREANLLVA